MAMPIPSRNRKRMSVSPDVASAESRAEAVKTTTSRVKTSLRP